ncbi:MAG: ribosome-recycling factor [bacterium]|nr:ribosome-recycling factor [bacterium]
MIKEEQLKIKMDKAVEVLKEDLSSIRVGQANPSMVAEIRLSVYNGTQNLSVEELATITTEDPSTISITPFDISILEEIEKGLRRANTNMSVIPDEDKIRLKLPPLTAERREEFVILIGKKIEGARIMVRQIRQEAMHDAKGGQDRGEVSEDERFKLEKQVQEVTDKTMEEISKIGEQKETQVRSL